MMQYLTNRLQKLMLEIKSEIAALPQPVVSIVAALVTANDIFPKTIHNWLLGQIGMRVDLNAVSPVAETVIRLSEFTRFKEYAFGASEIHAQTAIIKALGQEENLLSASIFVVSIIERLYTCVGKRSAVAAPMADEAPVTTQALVNFFNAP